MGAGLEEEAAAESAGAQAALGRCARKMKRPKRPSSASRFPRAPRRVQRSCVLLLSGGLDSATCLALVSRWGWTVHALSFDYGQRHRIELRAARALARKYRAASHRVIAIPAFGALGGSALTDRSIRVPKMALGKARIPSRTFPPATRFFWRSRSPSPSRGARRRSSSERTPSITPATPTAARHSSERSSASRSSGRRPACEGRSFAIRAPLLHMSKADIVRLAVALGLDTRLTISCYDPGPKGHPCGSCDSCLLRSKGFREAGISL